MHEGGLAPTKKEEVHVDIGQQESEGEVDLEFPCRLQ